VGLVGLALASAEGSARAQGNARLAPVGGRTTLVGGTGLAFGRDSASAFLNPATVVRVDPGRLSFSVNFYELSSFTAPSWYQPAPVDAARFGPVGTTRANATSLTFDALPSSLCLFLRVGELPIVAPAVANHPRESQARLGLCFATIQGGNFTFEREDYSQPTAKGASRQAQTVSQTFQRFAAGPTYAMNVTDALAVGASLHVSRTSYRSSFASTATTDVGRSQPITSSFYSSTHGESYDVSATLGLTYRVAPYQTVALALEAPSLHGFGTGGLTRTSHFEGASGGTSTTSATGDFAAHAPLRVGMGTGIERAWGSAEVNVSYHLPVGPAYTAKLDGRALDVNDGVAVERGVALDTSAHAMGVVNAGVGGEVHVAPTLSLLGGLSTDLTTVRRGSLVSDAMTYFPSRSQRVSASFGVGSHGEGGDLLVGGEVGYASGERLAVSSYQLPPALVSTPFHTVNVLFVVAGNTNFKAIRRAVNDLTNAVDPRKKPPPVAPPAPVAPPP
jgi:hypothetical protein